MHTHKHCTPINKIRTSVMQCNKIPAIITTAMARKKVKLEWISNDSARKTTFKKRKTGMIKKVSELSTLCDVKACMIVYGPNDPRAEVWPSAVEAVRVLSHLRDLPEMEQNKKMMNQDMFMRQRIQKLKDQLHKQEKENRNVQMNLLMHHCLAGTSLNVAATIEDVTSLAWLVEMRINQLNKMIATAKERAARGVSSMMVAPAATSEMKNQEGIKIALPATTNVVESAKKEKKNIPLEAVAMEEYWFPQLGLMRNNELQTAVHPYVPDNINNWLDAYNPLEVDREEHHRQKVVLEEIQRKMIDERQKAAAMEELQRKVSDERLKTPLEFNMQGIQRSGIVEKQKPPLGDAEKELQGQEPYWFHQIGMMRTRWEHLGGN